MSADFGPIAKSTLADKIAKRVAQMIRNGSYAAGDRLPSINDMASRFGVGHPTLREALKKLETLGLVTVRHGSGVYVQSDQDLLLMSNPVYLGDVSKKMLLDLIEARIPIEVKAVVQAAHNVTDEQIARMEALLNEAAEHIDDDSRLTEANMGFHREIASASGNVVLAQLLKVLSNLFEREQRTILDIYGSRDEDHAEHLGILDALRARDEAVAEQRMREHLEGVRETIQQWNPEQSPVAPD